MNRKKIVVLTGSPRKAGNSAAMAAAFIREAEAQGCAVQRFDTAFLRLGGCRGCYGCRETGRCVIRDDFPAIDAAIRAADAVVLVTPLYFFSFSAQLKQVIDRFFSLHRALQLGQMETKQCALLACCADETPESYQALRYCYERLLGEMEWSDAGTVLATGIWGTPDPEKLRLACEASAALAERIALRDQT